MVRPQAIYASIPCVCSADTPLWLNEPGFSIPTALEQPYEFWPDLNWLGNLVDDTSPTVYDLETPQYLWAHPVVQDPQNGETHTFVRGWKTNETTFNASNIPPGEYLVVISHAADDQYEMRLAINNCLQFPVGSNSFIPAPLTWRNVSTYVSRFCLTPCDLLTLTSIVTNDPQPNGTSQSNLAMFTWIMQVYAL